MDKWINKYTTVYKYQDRKCTANHRVYISSWAMGPCPISRPAALSAMTLLGAAGRPETKPSANFEDQDYFGWKRETDMLCLSVCMYVCMYLCIYLSIYLSIYVSMYLCIYVSMYLCIYVSMYLCIYVSMYLCIYVCMYVCIYVSMYLCIYVSMYLCMYVCMYVCMRYCILYKNSLDYGSKPPLWTPKERANGCSPLNYGILLVLTYPHLASQIWLQPYASIPTWISVSATPRGPPASAALPGREPLCWNDALAVGMTTELPPWPPWQLGLPARGSVAARDQSCPGESERKGGRWSCGTRDQNAPAECGQGDKGKARWSER